MKKTSYIFFSISILSTSVFGQAQPYNDQSINSKEHYFKKQSGNFGQSAATSLQNSIASMTSINALDCNAITPSSVIFAATGATHVASDISRAQLLEQNMQDELERLNQIESNNNKNGQALISLEQSYNKLVDNIEQQQNFVAASIISNKAAAAAAYADSLPRTAAQLALIATANACVTAGSAPAFAAVCQGCIQRALNAVNIVRTESVGVTDGGRAAPPLSPGSSYDNIRLKEDEDQSSINSLFKFQENQFDSLNPLIGILIKPANAMFSCNPACTPCQNVDNSIDEYFTNSITALDHCPDKLASPTDFLSGVLAKQLGVGSTLTPVAISLAPSTASYSYNYIQTPLDRGSMIEATADLAQQNLANLTQNLETVKQNRERVRSLIANFERQRGVQVIDGSSSNIKKGNVRVNLSTGKSAVSTKETGVAAADFDIKVSSEKEAELRNTLRKQLRIPCVGGAGSNGLCKKAPLADIVYNSQANNDGVLNGLLKPLDLISELNVAASNGQYSKALKLASILSQEENRAKVDFTLSQVKNIVNQELEQTGQETVDFDRNKITYQAGLSFLHRKILSETRSGKSPLKQNLFAPSVSSRKVDPTTAKYPRIQNQSGSKYKSAKQHGLKTVPGEREQIIKHRDKASLADSEQVLSNVEIQYADIIQNPKIPLFEAVSNRYIKSARPVLLPKKK